MAAPFGLRQTTMYSWQVEAAIASVNSLLPVNIRLRLAPAWDVAAARVAVSPRALARGAGPRIVFTESPSPRVLTSYDAARENCTFAGAERIPVFLVDDARLSKSESLFVPDGQRSIIVNADSLSRLWERLGINEMFGGSASEPTRIHTALVTVLLLHEVGHLHFEDVGSYRRPEPMKSVDFFRDSDQIANPEVRADRFAIERVLAFREGSHVCFEGFFGYNIDILAGDLHRAIRGARSAFEIPNDPFGAFDGLPKPLLLRKGSYSHPDLDLRFMCMDALLYPNDGTLSELLKLSLVRDADQNH